MNSRVSQERTLQSEIGSRWFHFSFGELDLYMRLPIFLLSFQVGRTLPILEFIATISFRSFGEYLHCLSSFSSLATSRLKIDVAELFVFIISSARIVEHSD